MLQIVETNPNETTGGGGCLCSGPVKNHDTQGPFVVFPATETDSNLSPFAVACAHCIREACAALERAGVEGVLAGGEKGAPEPERPSRRRTNRSVAELIEDADI